MADLKRRIIAEFSAQNKAKGEMAGFRRDMDNTGRAMKRMATGALAMVGMGGGLYALKRAFEYVTKAAMKQEDALFLLEAALKAAGEYSAETMKGFEAFAASIQKATVYGDEEVLALMQLMKSLGVTSAGLEQATKMAIGLAAATGRDVTSMSMYIALAQQGEFTMLRRYIPALRSTTDATEQLRIITEFAARGFKIAEAQAETTSGTLKQMANAVSDLAEAMAEPYLEPMTKDIGSLTILIQGATEALKKFQVAAEKVRESREKFGLRPMGFPRVPMPDLEKRFERRKTLGGKILPEVLPEVIRFEEPEWLKATLDLNVMTEAQEKAAASMYEMSMKARGLGEELAREKKMTQFAALAKVHYGADVEGAKAAQERFTRALKETEMARTLEAAAAKKQADAMEVVRIQLELDMKRWDDVARAMEDSFANAFEAIIFEAERFGDVMKAVARDILMEMMRIMMFRPAAQELANLITIGVSGLAGMLGGGGMPTAGTVTPEAGATLARYQRGGIATRPHFAMIGEVPEAIVPLSGGRSIPVEMRGGVGGGGITVNLMDQRIGTSEKLTVSRSEEYFISNQRVIDIVVAASQTDRKYRKSIKQASR